MKLATFLILIGMISLHLPVVAQPIDVSNVVSRPKCVIGATIKLVEAKALPPMTTVLAQTFRFPSEVVIKFNGMKMELPPGFVEIFLDASRIIPLRDETTCGFYVERGDASTSNRLAVYFSNGRIKRVDRFDLKGRVVSSTTFHYPGSVVLN